MTAWMLAAGSAFWLGILNSISPCPLATNIAAVSFVGRHVDSPGLTFFGGLLYTLGRSLAYTLLGVILVSSVLSVPTLAHGLQKHSSQLLGPILIGVSLALMGWITVPGIDGVFRDGLEARVERMGIWGAGLLGFVFALSLCPTSAALFFGSLLPLSIHWNSQLIFPAIFGIGTGLPVLVFAVLISLSAHRVGQAFDRLKAFEIWARRVTAGIFFVIGMHYMLVGWMGISLLG